MTEQKEPNLIELENFPDVLVTGIDRIERLPGDLFRFVFVVERQVGHDHVRVTVANHVWPLSQIPRALRQTAEAISADPLFIEEDGRVTVAH